MKKIRQIILTAAFGFTTMWCQGQATMVADINTGGGGAIEYITALGTDLYFSASDGTNGKELWKYDGTTATMVADINPGAGQSYPSKLTVFGTDLYFTANDGTNGVELWKYDGTTATMVADINPGIQASQPGELTVLGTDLYFTAKDGTNGRELWKYDGTTATMVADINPGAGTSIPNGLTVLGTDLYFSADDGTNAYELWKYDGTTATLVQDIWPGSNGGSPLYITASGTNIYFFANDGTNGTELWKSDGTTTSMIQDINPGSGSAYDGMTVMDPNITAYGSDLYFIADNGTNGAELWKYDGTIATMVQDINSGAGTAFDFMTVMDASLTVLGTDLLFVADNGTNGAELWNYDGTIASMVQDINPGTMGGVQGNLTILGTDIYFTANDGTNGYELWKFYNGTSTAMVQDINPGAGFAFPSWLAVSGGSLFFSADDGTNGAELWELTTCTATTGTNTVVACDQYSWHGTTYTSNNNTATYVETNAAGCDSTITLDLTINYSTPGTTYDTVTACGSYTWINGYVYTANNNWDYFTLTNAAGCDSVVTLNLTIGSANTGTDTQTACGSYTWIDGNAYTTNNTTATHTLTNAVGCDSVVTLNLTINNSSSSTDTQTACGSYTWIDGNAYTTNNTTATHTLTNAVGCDSVVTLNLTINNSSSSTDTQTACGSYTWIDGNAYTTNNTTATHTLTNAVGCDSVVTLNLTINTVDVSVTTNDPTITANATSATYQWLDCNNSFAVIAGETSQSYTAASNGDYAVEVTENGCVDTSACVTILTIGMDDLSELTQVIAYPNPVKDHLVIDLAKEVNQLEVQIFDLTGKVIFSKHYDNTSLVSLDFSMFDSSIYFVHLVTDTNSRNVFRINKVD